MNTMSDITTTKRSRRKEKTIDSNEDLYNQIATGSNSSYIIQDENEEVDNSSFFSVVEEIAYDYELPKLETYDYTLMHNTFGNENIPQQLGNYISAMNFMSYYSNIDTVNGNFKILDRLKDVLYNFPNFNLGEFSNAENGKIISWITSSLVNSYNNKYLGTIYILGGEIGLLAASIIDTKLKFENIRSFDINGTGQFIADYMMQDELLNNWKFKATTQDIYNINYETNAFSAILPDGTASDPFEEIPGLIINHNISYLDDYESWWSMIPTTRNVVLIGRDGDVPRSFKSSTAFNRKFVLTEEIYSGVLRINNINYFMKIGTK